VRLDQPQLENVQQEDGASLFFQLPAGEIWHFRRQLLSDGDTGFIQIEASEITQLYHMSKELYQNNIRLYNLRERQEALLSDIAQINRESELLATKMRIHDDLGRCLVATKRVIGAQALSDAEYRELLNGWEEAIRDMTNIPLQSITKSPEEELRKVADLVGCKIELIGEQPAERRALLLLYHAIREALTNAVRHAGADRLTVTITQDEAHYHILIASNGKSSVTEIRESGGLGSLRKSLEQEGASLSYLFGESVTVVVDIPYRKGGRSV